MFDFSLFRENLEPITEVIFIKAEVTSDCEGEAFSTTSDCDGETFSNNRKRVAEEHFNENEFSSENEEVREGNSFKRKADQCPEGEPSRLSKVQKNNDVGRKYEPSHSKNIKDMRKRIKAAKENIICSFCGSKFTNRERFIDHMNIHKSKDKSLHCEECAKQFKTQESMNLHVSTDHGRMEGPVDCPICSRKYQNLANLRSHFYVHTMEKKFLCGR